jgi:DNA repair exonuclease SbcCD ATPase subunit
MGDRALMDEVVAEIKAVNEKLEKVEAEIVQARAEHNEEEVAALRTKEEQLRKEKEQLRTKEEQLRKEKEQLRTKEEQLRAEKLLLLARQPGAPCRVASVHVAPRVHARCSSFVRSFVFWFRAWQSAGGLECAGSSRCEL